MTKRFYTLVSLLMVLGLLVTACTPSADAPGAGEGAAHEGVALTAKGQYPIVETPVTLNVLIRGHAIVEDFETNYFTNWYEERTGVRIEFDIAPPGTEQEKLNLVLASGDLPDIIVGFGVNASTQSIYGAQGVFLPLNDLIEEKGVHIHDVFEGSPLVEDLITSPDGNIYGLPHVNECYHCFYSQRAWINQTWLDNLGLTMPQTTEDFFTVLTAFKEQDPNGNGKADEIPLAAATTGWNTNLDGFLMNPFIFSEQFNNNRYLILENGQISSIVDQEGWRDGLAYLKRLYDAGLFGEESFTQEHTQIRQLVENEEAPLVGAIIAGAPPVYASIAGERWHEYASLPPLEGPTGLRQAPYNPYGVRSGDCVISATTAYPEVAFRWCDGLYEREVTLHSVFGRIGEEWNFAEAGSIGLNGEPAIWERYTTFNEPQNYHWAQIGPSYRPNHLRLGEKQRGSDDLEVVLYRITNENMEPYGRPVEETIPPLVFSEEQSIELSELQLSITDYLSESAAQFVLGQVDLDADWGTYVDTLNTLGLQRMVQIYQEAYDLKYAK
ncbi:extracellular solute-binding protein [Chloroflexi bacterium TSY]|nr:extracellular solute-binding protein [Chloroflexi bacterium TSY]